jgi:hypothetical protein
MNRYEREFGTDWDSLSKDEATDRAYAIGVAERLGETNHDELEAIYGEMRSSYYRSMVELAYEEGRNEAKAAAESATAETVWTDLVESDTTENKLGDERGRDGLPEALDGKNVLDRQDVDSTETVERPDFLDR